MVSIILSLSNYECLITVFVLVHLFEFIFNSFVIFILQVDLYLLSQAAFPTGGLYFNNQTWAEETEGKHVIIHNNYIIGYDNKMKRFHDFGLWLVYDHAYESPLGKLE